MKSAHVVIGANFGDEGKGLFTDYYAAQGGADTLVVRFNGGAQAGHTVTTPVGIRHVFHHFGSGTLAGASTYLSRYFVSNPLLFFKELDELNTKIPKSAPDPVVWADGRGLVTVPYDMLINQIIETQRGDRRHGSCGVGFGEAIQRSLNPRFSVTIRDLYNSHALRNTLVQIRDNYVPKRLAYLGAVVEDGGHPARLLKSDAIIDNFIAEVRRFTERVRLCQRGERIAMAKHVVFEGAQGLLLDEDHPWFPHVTRSKTGLRNAVKIALEAGIEHLDVTYATRCYWTRHGAGPLPGEFSGPASFMPRFRDDTNVTHEYQGSLRFAPLDVDIMSQAISNDRNRYASPLDVTHRLGISCLDQVTEALWFIHKGKIHKGVNALVDTLTEQVRGERPLLSRGPTRNTILEA